MSLESEISRLQSFAQQSADSRRAQAVSQLRLAAEVLEAGSVESFRINNEEAITTLNHSLQIGTLVEFLDNSHRDIVQAFKTFGLEIPKDEAEIRAAREEKDRIVSAEKAQIMQNLGKPDNFGCIPDFSGLDALVFEAEKGLTSNLLAVTVGYTNAGLKSWFDPASIFDALDKDIKAKLEKAGVTPSTFFEMSAQELLETKGIGEKRLGRLIDNLHDAGVVVIEPTPTTLLAEEDLKATNAFDRFTSRSRRTFILAKEEAHRLGQNYVNTEHLLLGIIRDSASMESKSIAFQTLVALGINPSKLKEALEFIIGQIDHKVEQNIGAYTFSGNKTLYLAIDELKRFRSQTDHQVTGINTGFLLIGLVREGEGIAAGVLESLGCNLERTRAAVYQQLNQQP